MLTIAYHAGLSYATEAELLRASLDRAGMEHEIAELPDAGDWYANTAQKPEFLRWMRDEHSGPLLYVDVDAFVHEDCRDYFRALDADFGAHYYRGPAKGNDRSKVRDEGWRLVSGTLYLGDTDGCRRLLDAWCDLNYTLQVHGAHKGGGQKNLWFLSTSLPQLDIHRLPGRYCYVFDRAWAYDESEPCIIEHTMASRENRSPTRSRPQPSRHERRAELWASVAESRPAYRPVGATMRDYWVQRYAEKGPLYVAKGSRQSSFDQQRSDLAPLLQTLVLHGGRVLDFGCGPQRFRTALEACGEYTGVDLIPGLGTEEVGNGLRRSWYRSAVAIYVLQHIVDEAEYWHWARELYACLEPGGRLVVVDHLPMEGCAAHMAPRGIDSLAQAGDWSKVTRHGDYDGHWIGTFEK